MYVVTQDTATEEAFEISLQEEKPSILDQLQEKAQERIERRDVIARFQQKSAIQNIAAHDSNPTVETNPIGSSEPEKIVRRNGNVPALAKTHRPHLSAAQKEHMLNKLDESILDEGDKYYSMKKMLAS